MDPLSATLAVISLATAVKDLVEIGQKIHESFTKVSNNYGNARRVADEIEEMVEEIRTFCDDHKDALEDARNFRVALQSLLIKFRDFETSILPLLPKKGGRKRDRLLRGWDAWRNNNKVEDSILELQNDIVKVMRRYMMKSTMRTEVKLETIHQETSRGLEVLDVVRRDVSALRMTTATTAMTVYSGESSRTTNDEFTRNVIMFAKSTPSTSIPMLRTPDVITEELLTIAYIKLQINNLAMIVEKMSKLPASAPNNISVNSIKIYSGGPIPEQASMNIMHLRHQVVRQVTSIRDLLDAAGIQTISVHDGAAELNQLATGLSTLRMGRESILVRNWAIVLARTLLRDASSSEQPDAAANLALYLLNQCQRCGNSGSRIQGLRSIKEAYTIIQNLRNHYGRESRFQILYSDILLEYAKTLDIKHSIEMSVEAIQILENILNVQALDWSKLHEQCETVVQPCSSFLDRLFSSVPTVSSVLSYASALQELGGFLLRERRHKRALSLQLLGIAVRRKIVSIHGHVHKAKFACALSLLARGGTASYIPAEQLVDMVNECIQLFRELAEKNPLYYARQLVNVLWVKAQTLERLNRRAEAISTWEEVASFAGQIIQDAKLHACALHNLALQFRRVRKLNDAVRAGTLAITTFKDEPAAQAQRYFNLSEDLRQLQRYKESEEAAQTSVPLYRRLAMTEPKKWMNHLSAALANLAQCMAILGDTSGALTTWEESVVMMDSFLNTKTDASLAVMEKCYATLYIYPFISLYLEDRENSIKVSSTAARCLHQLSEMYPKRLYIIRRLWTETYHAYNFCRVGRLSDAQQYIDRWFDLWTIKPEPISESEMHMWQAHMINLKAEVLDAQGSIGQALSATRRVYDILRRSDGSSVYWMVKAMIHEARLQLNLGNREEALQIAENALQRSRENKPTPTVRGLVFALHTVAFTSLSCRNYEHAIEAAREGLDICAGSKWQNIVWEHDVFIPASLFAILSSAEANLGRCSTALEHAKSAVNASLAIRDKKWNISATVAKGSYMETRGNLADILLTTGDLAQARQIYEERRDYFSDRVENRMGDYRELAPILRVLGILCCSEGRHEAGDAAAKELSRIMKTLRSAFPNLQEQVKIQLRDQATAPILKALDDMSQKLDCGHQAEVLSLFAD